MALSVVFVVVVLFDVVVVVVVCWCVVCGYVFVWGENITLHARMGHDCGPQLVPGAAPWHVTTGQWTCAPADRRRA